MQVKVLAGLSTPIPTSDTETSVDPVGTPTSPSGSRVLNYLGSNPVATNGPYFTGVFKQRMQQVLKFTETGELYQSQGRDGGATGDLGSATVEDQAISRFNAAGIFQDAMILVDGGHGFSVNLESRGAGKTPYIWTSWAAPNGGAVTNVIVRFPYVPGTFTYSEVAGLEVYPSFGHTDVNLAMDWRNDTLCLFTSDNPNSFYYQQRKISEYKAGIDTVYNSITTDSKAILQGFFTYENSLFVYTGQSNSPTTQPVRLREYDWATGALVTTFDGSNLGKVNGKYPGDWYEPEGASLYDLDGTAPTVLLGMTFYPYGSHQSQYFTIPLRTQAQALANLNPVSSTTPTPVVTPAMNAELGSKLLSAVPVVAGPTLHPAAGQVLQCIVYVPTLTQYFTSQALPGTNGSDTPYQNCVISRLSSTGALIDSMTLHDAGHGTSFGATVENGQPTIYMNYQTLDNALISFTYTPGTFDNSNLPNMVTWPKLDAGYDNMQFDWDNNIVVMRNSNGTRDSYIRRLITEWKAGTDGTDGRIDLQQGPPTLQGFCTMNDAFFRLIGGGSGASVTSDRQTYIQQYSWDSTLRLDQVNYTNLGKSSTGTYPGGYYEPEGVTMYREADGTATIIFTVTFGVYPNHTYKVYKLPNIGSSVEAFNLADPSTANQNGTQSPLG